MLKKNYWKKLEGPLLGRPSKSAKVNKKQEYIDNADRIEVERKFALCKHKYGLGLVTTKLDETTRHSIVLSVLVMNVDRILATSLRQISILKFSRNKLQKFLQEYINKWLCLEVDTC